MYMETSKRILQPFNFTLYIEYFQLTIFYFLNHRPLDRKKRYQGNAKLNMKYIL